MENNLRDQVMELESQMGGILLNVETITDIKTLLADVRVDMDNLELSPESVMIYFRELHHKIRLMDDLMKYTTLELSNNYEAAQETKSQLFKEIVQGGKADESI